MSRIFPDFSIIFFGILDLTKANIYVLPLIVGGLQFIQMKLSMSFKGTKKGEKKNEMAMATSMMTYFMPVMIAVFPSSFLPIVDIASIVIFPPFA